MRYLITGGAGFIGSHLCEALLNDGHAVYVLDNESTGSRANLQHLFHNRELRYITGGIDDAAVLSRLVGTVHYVIHLAAAVGVRYILDHPLESILTNVVGTEKVLQACKEFEKPLFLASTSEVYGLQTHAPLRETDYSVIGATSVSRWSYACSKALDEFMALAFHGQGAFPVIIARFFNTVGPRQSPAYGMVMPRLVDQALRREPMTVYGDGSQTRTFTHVKDCVEAVKGLLSHPEAAGEVYNVGGIEEVSILNLAKRIKYLSGSHSEITLVPYSEVFNRNFEDMPRRVPDISKLQKAVKFHPRFTLDEIIKDVIADRRRLIA
jgi:UDP-glucose 4-epimerase